MSAPDMEKDTMNTYDPADRLLYIHVDSQKSSGSDSPEEGSRKCRRLPAGYANRSLRKRLWLDRTHSQPPHINLLRDSALYA
jgi:hypothetical protein